MKKILATIGLVLVAGSLSAATLVTNVTAGGVHLLSTSGGKSIYKLQVVSSVNPVIVELFDANSLAAPLYGTNSTNGAIVVRTSYTTNYVTSAISGVTGYTNWFTNAGLWTLTSTNSGNTNALSPLVTLAAAADSDSSATFGAVAAKGLTLKTTTNATVVIEYNPQ